MHVSIKELQDSNKDIISYEGYKWKGIGLQFDASTLGFSGGIELIYYFNDPNYFKKDYNIEVYAYIAGDIPQTLTTSLFPNYVKETVSKMVSSIKSFDLKSFTKQLSASVSVFGVWGTEDFVTPNDYNGAFGGALVTAWNTKVFGATSPDGSVFSAGFGISTEKFDINMATVSNYWRITSDVMDLIDSYLSPLKKTIEGVHSKYENKIQ